MRIFKIILFNFYFLVPVILIAQEGAILKPMLQDSSQIELERSIEYQQLISGQISDRFAPELFQLPDFNFENEYLNRYSINQEVLSFQSLPLTDFTLGLMSPFYSPVYLSGTVLSQAAYKVNDRFTFGGYSYGVNTLPTLPPPPGINNFNRYGSTMFMQYKVGKNFKIETRVNVSQGGQHPGY